MDKVLGLGTGGYTKIKINKFLPLVLMRCYVQFFSYSKLSKDKSHIIQIINIVIVNTVDTKNILTFLESFFTK